MDTKLTIEVFTSPTCPHCPAAVRATKTLLDENPELTGQLVWKEMSTMTPEGNSKAREYGIRSVPTIVITTSKGEKIGYVGSPSQKTYLEMVKQAMS